MEVRRTGSRPVRQSTSPHRSASSSPGLNPVIAAALGDWLDFLRSPAQMRLPRREVIVQYRAANPSDAPACRHRERGRQAGQNHARRRRPWSGAATSSGPPGAAPGHSRALAPHRGVRCSRSGRHYPRAPRVQRRRRDRPHARIPDTVPTRRRSTRQADAASIAPRALIELEAEALEAIQIHGGGVRRHTKGAIALGARQRHVSDPELFRLSLIYGIGVLAPRE